MWQRPNGRLCLKGYTKETEKQELLPGSGIKNIHNLVQNSISQNKQMNKNPQLSESKKDVPVMFNGSFLFAF